MAEFKEFERRFKFKPWLKYGWFHLKLYQMFQDLSRVLADLNRGSNSLTSISGLKILSFQNYKHCYVVHTDIRIWRVT